MDRSGKPGANILVIDDDEDLRAVLGAILEHAGYRVTLAASGREGLARLAASPDTDLILLDLMMPDMDGWRFRAEQLKDPAAARVPVVVVTASRNLETFPIDATAVVLKPFATDELLGVVRGALG